MHRMGSTETVDSRIFSPIISCFLSKMDGMMTIASFPAKMQRLIIYYNMAEAYLRGKWAEINEILAYVYCQTNAPRRHGQGAEQVRNSVPAKGLQFPAGETDFSR